jgi:hypothetical protein
LGKLTETLTEQLPHISIEDAKKVVKIWNDCQHERFTLRCGICLKKLNQNEINMVRATDYIVCCEEHEGHRNKFQIDIVRKELGIEITETSIWD